MVSSSSLSMTLPNETKENILMKQLLHFFQHSIHLYQFVEFIAPEKKERIASFLTSNEKERINKLSTEHNLSISLLDWFVTNYAKQHNTRYIVVRNNRQILFQVYEDYKLKLSENRKRFFDPFRRIEQSSYDDTFELSFGEHPDDVILTSLRQMHFFKWAIQNKVNIYLKRNIDTIFNDMKERRKKNQQRRLRDKQKRHLSVNTTTISSSTHIGIKLNFMDE
mgnify:CR=1 FL=1